MTVKPRQQKDLMLAPVAVEIDSNLQSMRDKSVHDVEAQLELKLDTPAMRTIRGEREDLILRSAIHNVEMHGWSAAITDDGCRVHLEGGSVSIDLGLSPSITAYIEEGVKG
jgi:hypothetical protein